MSQACSAGFQAGCVAGFQICVFGMFSVLHNNRAVPTWKSATQQIWKSALPTRFSRVLRRITFAARNGIDLQGFQIGSIGLHVDSLTISSPGSNPNGDGIWTDVFFEGTVTVYAVPEPSSLGLLGIFLGCVISRRIVKRPWRRSF
jgi:PEP-CTERM motif